MELIDIKKNKAFTLIELLAVIIILGVLMIIAIPSVTEYINSSRKDTYITIAKNYISAARNKVNSLEYPFHDTNYTYYVPYSCLSLERGGDSPFGDWEEAYAAVSYIGNSYEYYWTSYDSAGYGIDLTREEELDPELLETGYDDLKKISVSGKENIRIVNEETCNGNDLLSDTQDNDGKVEYKYIYKESLVLNLSGLDSPNASGWANRVNGEALSLIDVNYDTTTSSYVFNGTSSYATASKPYIPETGDFTLELYFSSDNIRSANDWALVSQTSNTSQELGRFKLNVYTAPNKTAPMLRTYYFSTSDKTDLNFVASQSLVSNTKYHYQVVRRGDKLEQYLDGVLIDSSNFSLDNKIIQENFKISKWNNSSPQYFNGNIYSVRVYNKALDIATLSSNYESDVSNINLYNKESNFVTLNLKDNLVTSGDGLYDEGDVYRYRGSNPNNYVVAGGMIWRIVSFDKANDTAKLVTASIIKKNIAFDESGNRNPTDDTYCTHASTTASDGKYYGCNVWNKSIINGKNVTNNSTLNEYLNGEFYNSLTDNFQTKVISSNFNAGGVKLASTIDTVVSQEKSDVWSGKVGIPTTFDIMSAGLTQLSVLDSSAKSDDNYLLKMTNSNNGGYWLLNRDIANTYDIYYAAKSNVIIKRRASRKTDTDTTTSVYCNTVAVVNIKSNVLAAGSGKITNPYVIKSLRNTDE